MRCVCLAAPIVYGGAGRVGGILYLFCQNRGYNYIRSGETFYKFAPHTGYSVMEQLGSGGQEGWVHDEAYLVHDFFVAVDNAL